MFVRLGSPATVLDLLDLPIDVKDLEDTVENEAQVWPYHVHFGYITPSRVKTEQLWA